MSMPRLLWSEFNRNSDALTGERQACCLHNPKGLSWAKLEWSVVLMPSQYVRSTTTLEFSQRYPSPLTSVGLCCLLYIPHATKPGYCSPSYAFEGSVLRKSSLPCKRLLPRRVLHAKVQTMATLSDLSIIPLSSLSPEEGLQLILSMRERRRFVLVKEPKVEKRLPTASAIAKLSEKQLAELYYSLASKMQKELL